MSAIFPPRTQAAARAVPVPASRETLDTARTKVRSLLESSQAFDDLSADKREALAKGMVQIATYLAEPDGMRLPPGKNSPQVKALAGDSEPLPVENQPEFGQALRTGVQQAGALMQAVNFPTFVSGLIDGVFHSIVTSSIEQMEAYAKLVADVSKSLNQFRDDNTTQNQGRDHLVEQFPDLFKLSIGGDAFGDFGSFGDDSVGNAPPQPKVVLLDDINERAAIDRLNQSLPLDKPLTRLDDDLVEALLVPAARTQIATGRQQLLATLVMLGINRIVVTDGKISAKVMYDFQARDNTRYRYSASQFDHETDSSGNVQMARSREGSYEKSSERGTAVRDENGNVVRGPTVNRSGYGGYSRYGGAAYEGGNSYAKGDYKYNEQPIIKMMSTAQLQNDSSLQARASLAGQVEVNFKSDYMPLEKLANPESIAAIQMNAQPGMVKTMAGRPQPAAAPATTPPPSTAPAPAAPTR